MKAETEISNAIEKVIDNFDSDAEVELEKPPRDDFGDFSTSVCLEVANKIGENPRDFAKKVKDKLELPAIVEKVEVAGPGYINFFLNREEYGKRILEKIPEGSKDFFDEERKEKVIVEHTSANPNKPLHMGTMRCAILGDTIGRIADFLGYKVEVQNYINDLGRQSATSVFAYKKFLDELDEDTLDKKADFWVGTLYSKGAQYLEKNEDEEEKVDEIIKHTEERGNEDAELKDEIVQKSLKGQLKTSSRSNIFYDLLIFENDMIQSGIYQEGIEKLKGLDKVYEIKSGPDKGCLVINISEYEDELGDLRKPYKILLRSNGTATYVAKDIVLTLWKFGKLEAGLKFEEFMEQRNKKKLWSSGGEKEKDFGGAKRVINVIGAEQKYPQKVIKYSLKSLGFEDEAENLDHMHFKFVYLPGKVAYSGRKGNWKGKHGDAVLDKAKELAREEVEERYEEMSEEKREEIAEKVGVAAVRYFITKFTREKKINFSFEKALDWEGDSGPYLLYSVARAHGIMEKAESEGDFSKFEKQVEYELIRKLNKFKTVAEDGFRNQEPAELANYLKDLAEEFNSFYHKCPVLNAESSEIENSRLEIVEKYIRVMEKGLELLGMEPLKTM